MKMMLSYSLSLHSISVVSSTVKLAHQPSLSVISSVKSKTETQQFLDLKQRRSASYHPTVWDPKFIQSTSTPYSYELYGTTLDELKQKVRRLFKSRGGRDRHFFLLKLIDSLQRLGWPIILKRIFRKLLIMLIAILVMIFTQLRCSFGSLENMVTPSAQYTCLDDCARAEVFDKFKHSEGRFMESLGRDVWGLVGQYEASQHGMAGEGDLQEAKNFSAKHLRSLLSAGKMEMKVAKQVQQSLELPLRWRLQRLEALNFIDLFPLESQESSLLLELARLDYNLVQSVHQNEVKELAKWWVDLGLKEKLNFARDRLVENYLWAVGIIFEPQFSECRKGLTKFVCILTAIDDIYDIYGSLDELQRFTDAVDRWDIKAVDDLPEYMKLCYLAMFNFGNEIAYHVLRHDGLIVLSCVKEEWAKLCRSYMVEARWFYGAYTPTLEEYLENAWISVGGHAAMVHACLLLGSDVDKACLLDSFKTGWEVIYWASLIARLNDDLGTSKAEIARGDVAKSIQSYMVQKNATEGEARDHIRSLISLAWSKFNEICGRKWNNIQHKSIIKMSVNMARTAHCIYQHGDGIGTSSGLTKDRLTSLIIDPVPY